MFALQGNIPENSMGIWNEIWYYDSNFSMGTQGKKNTRAHT